METTARSSGHGPPVCLPDGTAFQIWQDVTDYRKAYYVDQQHPVAADGNPGTEDAPFLTIQRAAEVVEPAEKVLVKSGIYREWVRPRRGGTGPDGMISFEAAPGAEAIIRGSQVLSAIFFEASNVLNLIDYFGRPYPGSEVPVGPFTEGWSQVCRRLRLIPNR